MTKLFLPVSKNKEEVQILIAHLGHEAYCDCHIGELKEPGNKEYLINKLLKTLGIE